jgi:hypothetical protein
MIGRTKPVPPLMQERIACRIALELILAIERVISFRRAHCHRFVMRLSRKISALSGLPGELAHLRVNGFICRS